jgi:hypothetical protein
MVRNYFFNVIDINRKKEYLHKSIKYLKMFGPEIEELD